MAVLPTEQPVPPGTEEAPDERHTFDRPTWVFNLIVGLLLLAGAYLLFTTASSTFAWLGLFFLALALVALGIAWLVCLVSCLRRRRLGHGWSSAGAWLTAPGLVLLALVLHLFVGGLDTLAFRLSQDALTDDAQRRLANDPPPGGFDSDDGTVGWLEIDAVTADAEGWSDCDTAHRIVAYEVAQGMMVGLGYVYSPDGPPCFDDPSSEHVDGHWYYARLWD